jgi:hypothetical protein
LRPSIEVTIDVDDFGAEVGATELDRAAPGSGSHRASIGWSVLSLCQARTVWVWLLVIFVGIQFGAGWYEKLAIVPLWADAQADQVLAVMESSGMKRAGRAFWPFVSPVVALLAVINVVVAWRSNATYRRWWLAAGAVMTVYALASYGYFVPQMLAFQSAGDSWTAPEIETFATWWTGLNYLRMAIGGIGWLCALRALSLSGTAGSTNAAVSQPIS